VVVADLAVTADTAGFAAPQPQGRLVLPPRAAIARTWANSGGGAERLSIDVIDVWTACEWGRVGPGQPGRACRRAGRRRSRAVSRVTLREHPEQGHGHGHGQANVVCATRSRPAPGVGPRSRSDGRDQPDPDTAEHIATFLEKRAPVWSGG